MNYGKLKEVPTIPANNIGHLPEVPMGMNKLLYKYVRGAVSTMKEVDIIDLRVRNHEHSAELVAYPRSAKECYATRRSGLNVGVSRESKYFLYFLLFM